MGVGDLPIRTDPYLVPFQLIHERTLDIECSLCGLIRRSGLRASPSGKSIAGAIKPLDRPGRNCVQCAVRIEGQTENFGERICSPEAKLRLLRTNGIVEAKDPVLSLSNQRNHSLRGSCAKNAGTQGKSEVGVRLPTRRSPNGALLRNGKRRFV